MTPPLRIVHERLDSTNLEVRRVWNGEPVVVVAAEQSAGMGRLGRSWVSPRGGLWMSLGWPLRQELTAYQAIPLAVGLAVAHTLETLYRLKPRIKWPNDVLLEERKVAGVLCQAELDLGALVVGVGVNANFPSASLGEALRTRPVSLLDVLGAEIDLDVLEARLTGALAGAFEAYERGAWIEELLPQIRARLAWVGEAVACVDAGGGMLAEGTMRGVDDHGALQIETESGVRTLSGGEIQRRAPAR